MVIFLRKAKIFLINGFILTITTLLMRGVGLVFNIYISNKVGAEAIGTFSLIMSIYTFAITVATSGIGIACTYIVSEQFAKKNYITGINATKTCILFSILLSIASAFIIFLIAPLVSDSFLKGTVSNIPIYIIGLGLPFIAISSVINGYFTSVGKSYKGAISQSVEMFVKIVATIVLLNFNISKGIEYICISLILGDVISEAFSFSLNLLFYFVDVRKYINKRSSSLQMKRKIFSISFPIAITSYIKSGLSSFKQFLIPIRLEMSGLTYSMAVSQYGLVTGMVMPVLLFANVFFASFSNLLVPEFSRLLASQYYNRMKDVCNKIFKAASIFCICITGVFFFFANELSLAIYQSLEAAPMIRLLAPLVFFMYVDNIIDNVLKGINEQTNVMFCNILDLGVTIAIIYFAVPHLGINGYILSIFVSELLNFSVSILQLKAKIKYHINPFKFIIFPIIACFVAYIFICIIPFNVSSILIETIFKISVFVLIYIIIVYLKIPFLNNLKERF